MSTYNVLVDTVEVRTRRFEVEGASEEDAAIKAKEEVVRRIECQDATLFTGVTDPIEVMECSLVGLTPGSEGPTAI